MRALGCLPDTEDRRDIPMMQKMAKSQLPEFVNLENLCSPVRDQGDLGACTAFGCTSALERYKSDIFSPLWLYYFERVREGMVSIDSGAQIRDGLKTMRAMGCAFEKHWIYDPARFKIRPSCYSVREAKKNKILSYERVLDLDGLKEQLFTKTPVILGIYAYESFRNVNKTGIVKMPGLEEKMIGGHCVLAVGYFDDTKTVLCKNSWGTSWGNKGYFTLPYDYFKSEVNDMWALHPFGE